VIDRFERQRLAENRSLIALRLMMISLVQLFALREARWSEVDTGDVSGSFPLNA
jgi:hypothetical protein